MIDWHSRYLQQARWTRSLRSHLFAKADWFQAERILEVGCGTGAVLGEFPPGARSLCGLDIDGIALRQARAHSPAALLTRGDAAKLPYEDRVFDLVYCHFLLLWLRAPARALQEMKRVTKRNGFVLALGEPDHLSRVDKPEELSVLGRWQAEALRRQGADPGFGRHVSEAFQAAGIKILEAGRMRRSKASPTSSERQLEWDVIEADLAGLVSAGELQRLRVLDEDAWDNGTRVLHVPTYFALGQT